MIVDDDAGFARLIARLLQLHGYETTPFSSRLEALDAMRADPSRFQLVLTDLGMPQMSLETFVLTARTLSPNIPIIVSTGASDFSESERARLGVSEVLSKPWLIDEALAAVKRALSTPDAQR
jgi:DNA-binding NtrC family response regulator